MIREGLGLVPITILPGSIDKHQGPSAWSITMPIYSGTMLKMPQHQSKISKKKRRIGEKREIEAIST